MPKSRSSYKSGLIVLECLHGKTVLEPKNTVYHELRQVNLRKEPVYKTEKFTTFNLILPSLNFGNSMILGREIRKISL